MGKIQWHDGLNLGISEVDNQHKELIRMINDVLVAVKQKSTDQVVDKILGQLREYALYHFNAEEAFMEKINYPKLSEHKQLHAQLKKKVKNLQAARFHKEDVSWDEVQSLLSDWLIQHILRNDYEIARFVKEGGAKNWTENIKDHASDSGEEGAEE